MADAKDIGEFACICEVTGSNLPFSTAHTNHTVVEVTFTVMECDFHFTLFIDDILCALCPNMCTKGGKICDTKAKGLN